jgi:hypothetical protein
MEDVLRSTHSIVGFFITPVFITFSRQNRSLIHLLANNSFASYSIPNMQILFSPTFFFSLILFRWKIFEIPALLYGKRKIFHSCRPTYIPTEKVGTLDKWTMNIQRLMYFEEGFQTRYQKFTDKAMRNNFFQNILL